MWPVSSPSITAFRPSAMNRPVASRSLRRCSARTAFTVGLLSEVTVRLLRIRGRNGVQADKVDAVIAVEPVQCRGRIRTRRIAQVTDQTPRIFDLANCDGRRDRHQGVLHHNLRRLTAR